MSSFAGGASFALERERTFVNLRRVKAWNKCFTHTFSELSFTSLECELRMRLLILIVLIILVVGALPTWPYSGGWGYYPSGGLGTLLIILLVLALLGII
jgi:hypothetical protein